VKLNLNWVYIDAGRMLECELGEIVGMGRRLSKLGFLQV